MTTTQSPFNRRGFIAAAIIVGIILLAAIVVLVSTLTRSGQSSSIGPTPAATASPTQQAASDSICGLPGYESSSTLSSAPKARWELIGTVAAPSDAQGSGPGLTKDGLRTCYSHTAEGALFMAVNYVAMGTDATLYSKIPELVASGKDRKALESAIAESGPSTSSERAQVAGFKITAYAADQATVDLALNYATGQLLSIPLKLVWESGDWKVQLSDDGKQPIAPAPLENLGGYVPWSGA